MTRRYLVLANVEDLVLDLLVYDRKEDEDLPIGEIQEAINNGEVTISEIVKLFELKLKSGLNYD